MTGKLVPATEEDSDRSALALVASRCADPTEVEKWLNEGARLFAEARIRVEAGDFLPALSSLAALPYLQAMLCDRLSELANQRQYREIGPAIGMYL